MWSFPPRLGLPTRGFFMPPAMPNAAPKPCQDCGALVRDGGSRCDAHKVRPGQFADSRRGSRHARGYGSQWVKTRERILARDNGMCQCEDCTSSGRIRLATQVDHRVNKATWLHQHGTLAGVDHDSNLRAINAECHKAKTAREAQQGRVRGGGQ